MQSESACPRCRGTGKIIRESCPNCGGKGYIKVKKTLKLVFQKALIMVKEFVFLEKAKEDLMVDQMAIYI